MRIVSRFFLCVFLSGILVGTSPLRCAAGAFTLPEGLGQIIFGGGFTGAPQSFDNSGKAVAAAAYRKQEVSAYLQYGWSDAVTLILAPSFVHMSAGSPGVSDTSSSASAVGAAVKLYRAAGSALSLEVLLEPAVGSNKTSAVLGDFNGWGGSIKLSFAQNFGLLGLPAFVDGGPGVGLRTDGWPSEARFDTTLGLRPAPATMVLIQNFFRAAPAAGDLAPATLATTLQASVVQDLSPRFSLQLGGLRTLAGRNSARETGPFAALWMRF